MKVIAINGSPKKEGNTFYSIKNVAAELEEQGIEVEILHIGNKNIRGCLACGTCSKEKNKKCGIAGDDVNSYIEKMAEADGIILGSPVYFSGVAGTMKSFLDRAFMVFSANNGMLRHKVGVSVVAVRRSGGLPTFDQLNNFLNYGEMILPTSNYWTVTHGLTEGEEQQDEEGRQIMRVLGKNMAWLLTLKSQNIDLLPPEKEPKIYTNFVR